MSDAIFNNTIPLYYTQGLNGPGQIEMLECSNFFSVISVILHDTKLGAMHNLGSSPYLFIGDTQDSADRFFLETIDLTTGIKELENQENFIVYYSDNSLNIKFNSPLINNEILNVFNVLGQNVFSKTLTKGQNQYTIPKSELDGQGVYIVSIKNQQKSKVISIHN